ncbi:uncharacterized protein [Amphiura filiformis]|uniref:uncharacterized protein n=1 Tax=Amphiura filiformis TaxID=82378 RepID=UPI003B2235B3
MSVKIRGLDLHIPGIADDYDGELILTQTKIVEVELQDGSEKKVEIPSTMNISVVPYDPHKNQPQKYGANTSIHDIAKKVLPGKPVFTMFTSLTESSKATDTDLEEYGLKPGAVVVVHSAASKEAILVKGLRNGFLVPTEFRGEFKILADTFCTPYDLIKAGFKGKTRATNTCEVSDELQEYQLESIYEFDILEAVSGNTDDLQSLLMTRTEDTVEIVELMRTMSTKGHPGLISVPGDVEAHLVASTPSIQHHTMFEILQNGWAEFKASYSQPPNNALTEEDVLLVKDSPFQILGLYRYSVTYVIEYDTETRETGMTREIPEFVEVQARQLLTEPSVMGNIEITAPRTSITKLPAQRFERLATIVKPNNEKPYEDVEIPKPKISPKPKPKVELPIGHRLKFPTPPPSPDSGNKKAANDGQKVKERGVTVSTNGGQDSQGIKTATRSQSVDESATKTTARKKLNRKQSLQLRMQNVRGAATIQKGFHTLTRSFARSPRSRKMPTFPEGKSTRTKAKDVFTVKPPSDGDIAYFNVEQLAGLMRHLKFSDKVVEHCLTEEIDGGKLCLMDTRTDDKLKEELKLDNDMQLYTIRHFIQKSVFR